MKSIQAPELRFSGYFDPITFIPLGEVVDKVSRSVDLEPGKKYREIGVRSHGKGIFHKAEKTGSGIGDKKVYWVQPGALVLNIVFAWELAVAQTSEAEKGFIASHRFPMFKPKAGQASLEYLLFWILRPRGRYLLGIASPGGAGRNKTLNQSDFLNTRIPIPSLSEQQKIASFLSSVDSKLTKLRQKRELLETYKRGMMQKLFSQQLRFKADDGSEFPAWSEQSVLTMFRWVRTNSLSREFLSYEKDGVGNIHYGDIHTRYRMQFDQERENVPVISDSKYLETIDELEFCQSGDLVIADASEDYKDIGRCIELISVKKKGLVAGLHTYIARPKKPLARGFAGYLFSSWSVRYQIMRIAQGISVLGISKNNLEKIPLFIPEVEEQQKIADCLSAIDKKIDAVAQQIAQMETFKQGLLQKMFI
jgi:type I restriction enzyme S subunit